ncbi:MAG: YbbR-like domain-containing protein [Planctomycetes bacterium]|nr:YbbR-like domain-containing protein [Planctomycetota bacterium]
MISFVRGLFLNNLGNKIIALILAVICWFYIHNVRIEPANNQSVPLIIETPGQIISRVEKDGEIIKNVKVDIEYPKGASFDGLVCRHKIKAVPESLPQTIIVELTSSDFNLKQGMTIKNFLPDNRISVLLMRETVSQMKLKTEGAIKGTPQKGYRVTLVQAKPTDIPIKGPKNILDKYNEIQIAKIDVTNRNSDFSIPGRIETVENAELTPMESFEVDVRIGEDIIEDVRTVKINLLLPPDFPHFPIQIKPQEKALKFRGPASKIRDLKPSHINLFVNVGELCPNPAEVKPPMTFAPKLELRFTPDLPIGIELAEPLEQIKLEILPPPAPPEPTPEKPPEPPPAPPK